MCRKEGRGVVGLSLRINALIKDVIFHKVICLNYICPCCSFKILRAKLRLTLSATDIEKGQKTKTKEKYQNQTKNTYPCYKYILTLYTLTLAKSTNTIYTKQSTDPYLTFWMCKCAEIGWLRGGVREENTTISVGSMTCWMSIWDPRDLDKKLDLI